MQDHPRSRGVYTSSQRHRAKGRGSSPLARGLRQGRHRARDGGWIIPARAGFTCAHSRGRARPQDHPRSRGVYAIGVPYIWGGSGSSPLARGLLAGHVDRRRQRRIIPARAGFTPRNVGPRQTGRDHPRSRGVYHRRRLRCARRRGSSPLARGLPPPVRRHGRLVGIIPARAGFTTVGKGDRVSPGDHPRSRGVYKNQASVPALPGGSSPLARGLPSSPRTTSTPPRIIPARAGFTGSPARSCRSFPWIIPARAGFTTEPASSTSPHADHPRSRGVYRTSGQISSKPPGSSPLARGLLLGYVWEDGESGIIPARAGFTPGGLGGPREPRDHPRSRGVYLCVRGPCPPGEGSSPLARGLPLDESGRLDPVRIIPARAGFTANDQLRWKGHLWIIPARAGFTTARSGSGPTTRDHPRSRGVY